MEITLKLTELLAIYAACLSSIVFIWNVAKGIPRYKVDLIYGSSEQDGEYMFGIYISIKNPSRHTVHLSNVSLLYPYRPDNFYEKLKHIFKYHRIPNTVGWINVSLSDHEVDDKCPVSLEAGKSHDVFIPDKVVDELLSDSTRRKIRAVVQDQLWRNKYSSKFDYPKMNNIE